MPHHCHHHNNSRKQTTTQSTFFSPSILLPLVNLCPLNHSLFFCVKFSFHCFALVFCCGAIKNRQSRAATCFIIVHLYLESILFIVLFNFHTLHSNSALTLIFHDEGDQKNLGLQAILCEKYAILII